ncbi:MAG: S66 peptidase family protein [Pseudomonadales bacterium]
MSFQLTFYYSPGMQRDSSQVTLNGPTKPRKLSEGDTLAAVTLSWGGPGAIRERYEIGKRQLEETFGVSVVEMNHTCAEPDFVAANPQARAQDLHDDLTSSEISGIVATIGGNDSVRLLPYLDVGLIAENPKVFLGYSDTTVTHLAFLKAGVSSFYGPSIMSGFAENGGMHDYLIDSVKSALFESSPIGVLPQNSEGWTAEMLDWAVAENNSVKRELQPPTGWQFVQGEGIARGRLLGGCLEVLDCLRGTPLWPTLDQWKDAVLFIETSESAPTPGDVLRILRSFAACGVIERIGGLLLGRPCGQMDPLRFTEYDNVIRHVVSNELGRSELPIVTHMDFGHTDPMMTLPYGVLTEIDCDAQEIRLLESGVTD